MPTFTRRTILRELWRGAGAHLAGTPHDFWPFVHSGVDHLDCQAGNRQFTFHWFPVTTSIDASFQPACFSPGEAALSDYGENLCGDSAILSNRFY